MGLAVTTVAAGGLPVKDMAGPGGIAVTEVTTFGLAVTKVAGVGGGLGVTFVTATGGLVPTGDPFIANVSLLHGFEGTDGQTGSFPVEVGGHTVNINSGTAKISTTQKKQGNSSLFVGTAGASIADSPLWDLSDANTDQFTIEYSCYVTNFAGAHDHPLVQGAAGNYAFIIRHTSAGEVTYFGSSDGTSFNINITTTGAPIANNVWQAFCIEKDNTGTIRIYVNGVMRAKNMPANSALFNSTSSLIIGDGAAAGTRYIDEVRITKGKARYASDSGYTPSGSAFPRS